MKTHIRLLSATVLTVLTLLVACKKENASQNNNDSNTELTTQTNDQSRVSVETDATINDASVAMESTTGFSGNALNITPPICDATVTVDTSGTVKQMTIMYNSSNCSGMYTRTGSVVLTMAKGTYWKNAGAVVTIVFQNLKVTRNSKSITLNGTHTITNESGGLVANLSAVHSITYSISSSMAITFDDNTQRTWQVAEKREFTYDNGIVITITGNHTGSGSGGIAVWGTNRLGHAFTTIITQPLVLRQDCAFRLTAGVVKHEGWATATATFGLNATGTPTSCPGSNSYYCKVDWTGAAGKEHSAIFPY